MQKSTTTQKSNGNVKTGDTSLDPRTRVKVWLIAMNQYAGGTQASQSLLKVWNVF